MTICRTLRKNLNVMIKGPRGLHPIQCSSAQFWGESSYKSRGLYLDAFRHAVLLSGHEIKGEGGGPASPVLCL